MTGTARHCPDCADERAFVRPPCDDGHGLDCPDLACLECGFALVVGLLVVLDAPVAGDEPMAA